MDSTLTISATTVQTDCSILIMCIRGNLNGQNYTQLIHVAQTMYDNDHRRLILDLTEMQKISLAGLFALYNVAAIFNNQKPLDSESGWQAIRTMKHGLQTGQQARFKLSSPQPQVREALAQSGFDTFIIVFDNLLDAANSFATDPMEEMALPLFNVGADGQQTHSHYAASL